MLAVSCCTTSWTVERCEFARDQNASYTAHIASCSSRYVGKLGKDAVTGEPRSVVSGVGGTPCTIASFSSEDVEVVERFGNLMADLLLTDERTLAAMLLLQQKMGKQ